MATEQELKFLQRLTKNGKGAADMEMASDTLGLIDFDVQPTRVAIDLAKHSDGERILESMLKDWSQAHPLRWIGTGLAGPKDKGWTFRFQDVVDTAQAKGDLQNLVTIVDEAPTDPEVGRLYITSPSRTHHDVTADKIWLGGSGWTLTAPSGKSTTIVSPVVRRTGLPVTGPVNIAPFWTFLYKNGAAEAAKLYLAKQPQEEVEAVGRTKAERERIAQRRMALPEIHDVFMAITQERYPDVVRWLSDRYVAGVDAALRIQAERGRVDERTWAELGSRRFMKQEYDREHNLHWVAKPNYRELALAQATEDATAARESFVDKNTFRISEISRLKGSVPTATILSAEPGPTFNNRIHFSFPDGSSFELRNKTVWKTSPLGTYFAQFPTTFHDVVLPDGKPMAKPSEARMLEVFATKTNDASMRRAASKLARGG